MDKLNDYIKAYEGIIYSTRDTLTVGGINYTRLTHWEDWDSTTPSFIQFPETAYFALLDHDDTYNLTMIRLRHTGEPVQLFRFVNQARDKTMRKLVSASNVIMRDWTRFIRSIADAVGADDYFIGHFTRFLRFNFNRRNYDPTLLAKVDEAIRISHLPQWLWWKPVTQMVHEHQRQEVKLLFR